MIGVFLVSVLLLVLALLFLAHHRWENSAYVRTIDLIPGVRRKFIVGNVTALPKEIDENLEIVQGKWVKQYGRIYRIWLAFRPFVQISSPDFIEKILTSHTNIDKGKSYSILRPWLGDGLLLASGDKWRRSRRLLTPAFHFQILDNFFDVFNKNAEILCEQLAKVTKTFTPGEFAEDVDVFPFLKKCTLDIICEAAMGITVNAQLEDSEYIRNVHRISEIVIDRFLSGKGMFPDWLYHLTPSGREHKKILKQMHDFTSKVIRERKVEIALEEDLPEVKKEKRRAFLDLMLLANKNGVELSDLDIRNEVDTFMFEGHDTTASAIVWFLYCMAINPKHQALVQEELNEVFGDSDRSCTMEDATKLKYLECCIKESLRLYPPVPIFARYMTEEIELGGYSIPKGTFISLQTFALHRNEEYFPDPDVFKPERFQTNEAIGRHSFAYVPFSAGSRNCIGQRFAMFEEKVLSSTLLRRFRFYYDLDKLGPRKAIPDLVLKPKNGMPLQIAPYLQ
ncbi:hypothetical protein DAPPUDRAFT_311593 [Daphnia pulex]|uniref:Cytochrome P450 n=1 Tax=Daphnia pulex TaxID=6669 RepID=E9FXC5_DAPPU|nr:hypothetical protein DAPPUDRAFT_311593 [Daphnia pulex]|eukprot:EFX88054.1 hypothetical protein DAPPUDRAFT_311593 [Daphnia pulex]